MANIALKLERLQLELRQIAPVVGMGGTVENPIPKYDPEPTAQQLLDVEAAIAAFDWSDEADAAYLTNLNPERKALREAAMGAIEDIDNFLAIPIVNLDIGTIRTAVRRLAMNQKHIIKRLIQID